MQSNKLIWLLLIYLFFVQFNIYTDPVTNASLNFYHALIPVYFLFFYKPSRIVQLNSLVCFFIISSFFNLFAYMKYGFSLKFVQFFLCILSSFLGYCFVSDTTKEDRNKIYAALAVLVVASVLLRNIYFLDSLSEIYSRSRNVRDIFFISSGGRNIEVTLLGLLSLLVLNKKKLYYLVIGLAIISSTLMMSRAGLVTATYSLLLYFMINKGNTYYKAGTLCLFILCALVLLTNYQYEIQGSQFYNRLSISNDLALANENQGRVALWGAAFDAISKNYFGYGVGNGIKESILLGGIDIRENNIHNIYIQYLLELGVLTLISFTILTYKSIRLTFQTKLPEGYIFCGFFVLGLFQFTGYEPFIWFFSGSLFYMCRRHCRGNNE